ncbi:hypothetical protein [Nocardia asiatica]|uniref:hypothetical protein n=1 Tax=Nocardia asiatica TaxID=209252 RepID=UPI002453B2BB|nr:hypothetical protein [Nocardia asiatica]
MQVLCDGGMPLLSIDCQRDAAGVLTVEMRSAELAQAAPMRRSRFDGAKIAQRHTTPAARCGCPRVRPVGPGGVHVRHHERCLHGEPRRYVWSYAGALHTGILADYGEHFESLDPQDQHRLTVSGDELRTRTERYRLHITTTMTDTCYLHYRLAVTGEWVELVIDTPC